MHFFISDFFIKNAKCRIYLSKSGNILSRVIKVHSDRELCDSQITEIAEIHFIIKTLSFHDEAQQAQFAVTVDTCIRDRR